jgi:putative membrane protein
LLWEAINMKNKLQKYWRKFRIYTPSLISAALGLYLCALYFGGANQYYINSNYFNFNLVMGVALLASAIASLFLVKTSVDKTNYLPLLFVLALVLIVPAAPLSSATAAVRSLNVAGGVGTEQEVSPLLQKDPRLLRISDWVKLQNFEADYTRFAGQQVDVVGFIFKSPGQHNFNPDNFLVGRFVVTCCAVDASPLGLELTQQDATGNNLLDDVKIDDWVRVEGEWKLEQRGDEQFLVVVPNKITKVERPSTPYE